MLFTVAGEDEAVTPYDNSRMERGYAWNVGHVYEEGDWRFFFYDADAGYEQQYLYVRNQWGDVCGTCPPPTRPWSGVPTSLTSSP